MIGLPILAAATTAFDASAHGVVGCWVTAVPLSAMSTPIPSMGGLLSRRYHAHIRRWTDAISTSQPHAAIASGDKNAATTALKAATKQIDKAVGKGLWHKNAGARYISRLTSSVNGLK